MEKQKRKSEGRSFAIVVCVVACLLLNWPILSIVGDGGETAALGYLFFVWLFIISGIAWYCRREAAKTSQELDTEEG